MSEDKRNIMLHILLAKAAHFAIDMNDDKLLQAAIERDDEEVKAQLNGWVTRVTEQLQGLRMQAAEGFENPIDHNLCLVGLSMREQELDACEAMLVLWQQLQWSSGFPPKSVTLYSLMAEERETLERESHG